MSRFDQTQSDYEQRCPDKRRTPLAASRENLARRMLGGFPGRGLVFECLAGCQYERMLATVEAARPRATAGALEKSLRSSNVRRPLRQFQHHEGQFRDQPEKAIGGKMTVPGFSAEASLYKKTNNYRLSAGGAKSTSGIQLAFIRRCQEECCQDDVCDPFCWMCCTNPSNPVCGQDLP
jgi:hypothetical protein